MQIDLGAVIATIVLIVVAISILWFLFAKLYQRSTSEVSFVRTGLMGRRVVVSGGAFVVPVLHDVVRIGMNTQRLPVRCEREASLITRDRIRVDVAADFYVRVEPDAPSIAAAAQTLGKRTMSPDGLLDLIEGKFVDALRACAAETTLEELHEQRHGFAARVAALVEPGLRKNGLGIETVSIARLEQTGREFFNPNNAFDAEGLTWLTQQIEEKRRRRNEIERDTQVAIQRKNLAVEQQMLDLGREEEYARLSQEREIAIERARQSSEVAIESAARKREAEQAKISTDETLDRARIAAERAVKEERVAVERALRERELERARAVELAEIENRKAIEIAEQHREIEIASQASEVARARSIAERARAEVVKAEESVISARDLERAERSRQVEVATARAQAERAAVAQTTAAEAEREAAHHRAEAQRILTEAEVAAARLRAAADEVRYAIDAAGKRALYEAENSQSPQAAALRVKLAFIERLEAIIRESVKPLERIDGIKIVQLAGLEGGGNGSGGGGPTSLSDQVVASALKYRAQAPLVDSLLAELGLPTGTTQDLIQFSQHGGEE